MKEPRRVNGDQLLTAKGGPGPGVDLEKKFDDALSEASRFEVQDDVLSIYFKSNGLLELVPE